MTRIVDTHSRLGDNGREESRSIDKALCEMDAAGVSIAWICPVDHCVAVHNSKGNDAILAAMTAHPNRFVGCAVANPWRGVAAVRELQRAFEECLRVLFLHPPLQGFQLSDPLIHPLIQVAIEHHAPIYAHTGTPICAEPFQLAALARRYPEGRFIMGHMGYSDFWYDAVSAALTAPNILLETSRIDCDIIMNGIKALGPKRFLFGSDAPFCTIEAEVEKVTSLDLPPDDLSLILQGNAEALLA